MDITSILHELHLQHAAEKYALKDESLEDSVQLFDEIIEKYRVYRIKDKCRVKQKCYEELMGIPKLDIHSERTYIEVKGIFGNLNTAELVDKLRIEGISFEDVIYLSENDLKTIGVTSASERSRIMKECKRLINKMQYEHNLRDHEGITDRMKNDNTLAPNGTRISRPEIRDELKRIFGDSYATLADKLKAEDIGFEDVIYLSENDLIKLGVENASRIFRECKRLLSDDLIKCERGPDGMENNLIKRDPDKQSSENETNQGLQVEVELKENATFDMGNRGNNIRCNQTINASKIEQIGSASNKGNNSSCLRGDKISVKMKKNSTYRAVRENNKIETNTNYKADHIGIVNEDSVEGNTKVEMGSNSTFEINDSNNIFKSSQNRHIDIKIGDNVVLNGDLTKVDQATKGEPQPLKFHLKHGRNINLSDDQMTATRNGRIYESTDVFSSMPFTCGDAIDLRVEMPAELKTPDTITFGLTSCNPANLIINELPDDLSFLMEREEYWVIKENVCNKLTKGDILRLYLNVEGDVFYSINNHTEMFLMAVDASGPIWAHFRLNGSVQEIQILGNKSSHIMEDECQPITVDSSLSPSRPISTPRPEHLELQPIKFHQKCGGNISLKRCRTKAERIGISYYPQDTYLFTSRNIYPGERIDLQINTGGVDCLKFGLTVCKPEDLQIEKLPNDTRYLADREEYWLIDKLLFKSSRTIVKAHVRYTSEGYVLYSLNDEREKLLFYVDTSVDLWSFFVLGNNKSIEILSKDSLTSADNKESRIGKSTSSTDNNNSNIVHDVFSTAVSTAACIGATVVALPFVGVGAPLVGLATGAVVHSTMK